MNFGFRYQASAGQPYTVAALATSPWTQMVVDASIDFAETPDLRLDAADLLATSGTLVEDLFGYLSIGRAQRGRDFFSDFALDDVHLTDFGATPAGDIFDIDFWKPSVQTVLASEIAVQADQGFTGIFLDDFDRYSINKDRVESQIGGTYDADPLRNAAIAAIESATALANGAPDLDFIVNTNAFLLSSHIRFGESGVFSDAFEDEIDAFAAAVSGVVIENYWEFANATFAADFQTAVAAFAAEGIQVYVSHIFDPGVAREEVNAYYADAAQRFYIPTATTSALFDRFDDTVPVFDQATALADVLVVEKGEGPVDGGAGDDTIFGSKGRDFILGGSGRDIIVARSGADYIETGLGGSNVRAGAGPDIVQGGNARDRLFGQNGDDILFGNDGNDILNGGSGNNILSGGKGLDQFSFRVDAGRTVVTDLEPGVDRILMFVDPDVRSVDDFLDASRQRGSKLVYDYGLDGENVIVFRDTTAEDMESVFFAFG